MAESISPKYTSDSFIPIPSGESSHINSRANNDDRVNSQNHASGSHKKGQRSSTTDSFYVPWKRTAYSCGVIG